MDNKDNTALQLNFPLPLVFIFPQLQILITSPNLQKTVDLFDYYTNAER